MGIANIINTSTSSGGGGGEIIRELVNSSDGQGLHLESGGNIELANSAGAEFGTSDFSIELILNQEKENVSESYIYVTHLSGNNRLLIFHDVSDDNLVLDFRNNSGTSTKKDLAYDMNSDFGEPTHYVISADRSGNAVLYRNGTEVASVDISSLSTINIGDGNTTSGRIGTASTDGLIGSLYRFRTWNKALTHDEVDTCFQRADVDFADQYGSETAKIAGVNANWGTAQADTGNDATDKATFDSNYAWKMAGSPTDISVASNTLTFSTAGASHGIYYAGQLTAGKTYRLTVNVGSVTGGANYKVQYYTGSAYADVHTLASGVNTVEFTPSANNGTLYILATSGTAGTLALNAASTANSLVQIGCVVDYDLAFANPTQSLMVQDRAGAADGTSSASGVEQTQKIVQLNSTSARIGSNGGPETPADGELIASKVNVTTSGNGEVIVSRDSGAAARLQTQSSAVTFGATSNHDLQFLTNNTVYARLTNDGKFGVGVDPDTLLHLYSSSPVLTIQDGGTHGSNSTPYIELKDGSSSMQLIGATSTAGHLDIKQKKAASVRLWTNDTERMTIDSAGLVTCTSANQTTLTVVSSNAGFGGQSINASDGTNGKPIISWQRGGAEKAYDYVGTDNARYFNVNSADRLKIDSSGLATFSNGITLSGGFTTLGSFSELTIASGAVTATSSVHNIETEGAGATDYLDTINGGSTGTVLTLMAAHSSRTVVVEDGTNLKLAGDCTLDNIEDTITLVKNGSAWYEVSRSNNGA